MISSTVGLCLKVIVLLFFVGSSPCAAANDTVPSSDCSNKPRLVRLSNYCCQLFNNVLVFGSLFKMHFNQCLCYGFAYYLTPLFQLQFLISGELYLKCPLFSACQKEGFYLLVVGFLGNIELRYAYHHVFPSCLFSQVISPQCACIS